MSSTIKAIFQLIILIVLGYFLILVIPIKVASALNTREAELTLELTQGYTYYYNGQEVDKDTIDLSMYRYTIDNEKQAVYITDEKQIYYVFR